jgi:hypothetical protein
MSDHEPLIGTNLWMNEAMTHEGPTGILSRRMKKLAAV